MTNRWQLSLILSPQRKEYVKYAKVFPLTTLFDIKIASKWYRRVVGSLEMLSGLAMMVIPNREFENFSGGNGNN